MIMQLICSVVYILLVALLQLEAWLSQKAPNVPLR